MELNIFDRKNDNINSNFMAEFINELKKTLENTINKKQNKNEEKNIMEEYNIYERKKVFLDNRSRKGNDLAWVMDEESICISENGDGGPFFIHEYDIPSDAKIGEVYEKINGKYVYNSDLTAKLKEII